MRPRVHASTPTPQAHGSRPTLAQVQKLLLELMLRNHRIVELFRKYALAWRARERDHVRLLREKRPVEEQAYMTYEEFAAFQAAEQDETDPQTVRRATPLRLPSPFLRSSRAAPPCRWSGCIKSRAARVSPAPRCSITSPGW